MKRICCLFMAMAVLNLTIFASSPLTRGTVVYIRTMSEISSKTNETIDAIVDADVKGSDGKVLIKKGTRVNANVVTKKAKGVGKPGSISLKNLSTTSVDGQTIHLSGTVSEEGENKHTKVLAVGLSVGLLLFAPCLAYLAKKGGNAVIPSGTVYNQFSVADEYQIEL
ncbi:MAG: hypothetical protein J5671_01000 [Bacteroidaceae bacterium]|nr:hypothetical protein [Bacteroidaceae bacterium]